ncbi:Fc.00g115250.m01.CDS01 [Cosmosporella sp. VM-42]
MYPATVFSALLLTHQALTFPVEGRTHHRRQIVCAPIHLLVARGSTELPGDGALGLLAARIIQANPGATQEAIDYPALINNYASSVRTGTSAVQSQLTTYVDQCPDSKIVLLGYSQGAQILGDALCGGNAAGKGPVTPPIASNIADNVAAIVLYGDPRNVAGKTFDKGTSTTNGIFPRPSTQSCDIFANVTASYCDRGDPVCAKGNNLAVHFMYPQKYNKAAARFVNQKLA